jgi:type I restriction enzyme S subunit
MKAYNNQWTHLPIKVLFTDRIAGAWGEDPEDGDGIVCIRAADFITDRLQHKRNDLTRRKYGTHEIITRKLRTGDLIIEKSGGGDNQPVGRIISFALDEPALCSNFLERLRPNKQILHSRFGAYLLYSLWANRSTIPFIKQTTGIQNLDSEEYLAQLTYIPPIAIQRAIAEYLDRETEQIDALIEAKQRLLALLAEKRRALIIYAVTHGLDPNAPMRYSGVEWIGKVPAHWEVANLKFVGEVRTGVAKGRNLGNRETVHVPYLRVANVQDGYLDLSDVSEIEVLPEEVISYSLRKGDVLMNEGGDADKLGRGAVWDGSIDPCLHQNHVFAVRCYRINPYWLNLVTGSDYAKAYFESRSKQSTNLASISATNLQELPVVLPPTEEQDAILRHVDKAVSNIEALLATTEKTISLLQERRAALVAAAVTGQIDVAA